MWVLPTTFVANMLAGIAAARSSLSIPFVEPIILSSVVVLGVLVALAVKMSPGVSAAIVGFFGFFHGHAHGIEAAAAGLIIYVAGFALATAMLHATGIGLGLLSESLIGRVALRTMGGLAVLGGIALIAGSP